MRPSRGTKLTHADLSTRHNVVSLQIGQSLENMQSYVIIIIRPHIAQLIISSECIRRSVLGHTLTMQGFNTFSEPERDFLQVHRVILSLDGFCWPVPVKNHVSFFVAFCITPRPHRQDRLGSGANRYYYDDVTCGKNVYNER